MCVVGFVCLMRIGFKRKFRRLYQIRFYIYLYFSDIELYVIIRDVVNYFYVFLGLSWFFKKCFEYFYKCILYEFLEGVDGDICFI